MNLLPFFQWCEASRLATSIRASLWLFPLIEASHLVAFAAIGGALLMVDLRLLGVSPRGHSPADLAREANPFLVGALAVLLISGTLLFVSEAVKCYYSNPFWIKISALFLAIIFTFTVRRRVAAADQTRIGPFRARLVGLISIALWATVAWGGRWIGFSG